MLNGKVYLKVKLKSLAVEAKIIRLEESRALESDKKELYESLRYHRKSIVGTEARATLIAYGFLRGQLYRQIEPKTHEPIPYSIKKKVENMVKKYSFKPVDQKELDRLKSWYK